MTSVLAGAIAGLAFSAAGKQLAIAAASAIPTAIALFVLFLHDQQRRWTTAAKSHALGLP